MASRRLAFAGLVASALTLSGAVSGGASGAPRPLLLAANETVLILDLPEKEVCELIVERAGSGGRQSYGGVTVDLKALYLSSCLYLKEAMIEAAQAGATAVSETVQGSLPSALQALYPQFLAWLGDKIQAQFGTEGDAEPAAGDEDTLNKKVGRAITWLNDPKNDAARAVNAYLKEHFPSIHRVLTDGSYDIANGLKALYDDAKDKYDRFTRVAEEVKVGGTPIADALKKYGFSGDYVRRFRNYERRLETFKGRWGITSEITDAIKLLKDAFQTDDGVVKIGNLFQLMELVGGVGQRSNIPIVSLFSQIVAEYGRVGTAMLGKVKELEEQIRGREDYCIGIGTHDTRDARAIQFRQQFAGDMLLCPMAVPGEPDPKTGKRNWQEDVYVRFDPNDSRIYFFLAAAGDRNQGRYVEGVATGGGTSGVYAARELIEDAGALGSRYAAYAEKEDDVATIAYVFNAPFQADKHGSGIAGLRREADATIDFVLERLSALRGGLSEYGDPKCDRDKFEKFVADRIGLQTSFSLGGGTYALLDGDSELTRILKILYAINYVEEHSRGGSGAGASGAGSGRVHRTYSDAHARLAELSLLRIEGEVRDKRDRGRPCPDCAGASLSVSVSGGEEFPACAVTRADGNGAFVVHALARTESLSVRLSASAKGKTSEAETVDDRVVAYGQVPFVQSFRLTLAIPFDDDAFDLSEARKTLERLEAAAAEAEAAAAEVREACAQGRAAATEAKAIADEIRAAAALPGRIASARQQVEDARRRAQQAQQIQQQAMLAAELVVQARNQAEDAALKACEAAQAIVSEPGGAQAQTLLQRAQQSLGASRSAAASAGSTLGNLRAAAGRVSALLAGYTPPEITIADEIAALAQRQGAIAGKHAEARERAAQAQAAWSERVLGAYARGGGLLETGRRQLDPAGDLPAAKDLWSRMEAAFGRIAAARGATASCAGEVTALIDAQAQAAAEAGATLDGLKQSAEGLPPPDLGGIVAVLGGAESDANATVEVASIYAEAADDAAANAEICVAAARSQIDRQAGAEANALADAQKECATRIAHATAVWDKATKKARCVCEQGYFFTADRKRCINDAQFTAEANRQCAAQRPNSSAVNVDARAQSYDCRCNQGYVPARGACVDQATAQQQAAQFCQQQTPGSVPERFDPETGRGSCKCPGGTVYRQELNRCLNPGEMQDYAGQVCNQKYPGSVVERLDQSTGASTCNCPSGTVWNEGRTACINVALITAAANRRCQAQFPNTQASFTDGTNYTCVCVAGFTWNAGQNACLNDAQFADWASRQCAAQYPNSVLKNYNVATGQYFCGCNFGFTWTGSGCVFVLSQPPAHTPQPSAPAIPPGCHRNPRTGQIHCGKG
ncbi:MAG: hypothetical protein L6R19_11380 [Alphaproteobacteria bacterium]|nr:hypothetical protein [Alphaproteobacteria bacterium]